jgi:NAD(P)-dependent dehydrogenase (short-subunit alcohol dehydrogenase family)
MVMIDLKGKTALVTGGARGIGLAVGQALYQAGANVLLTDLDEASLAAARSEIGGERVAARKADASDPDDMRACVAAAVEAWGGLDVAILNAGIEGVVKPIVEYPLDRFDQVIAVNLRGVFVGLQCTAPAIAERGGGAIVIMSSVAGVQGTPGFSAYTASKHGVVGLMRCAALELAPRNIRVNNVHPGPIETRMMRSIEEGLAPGEAETAYRSLSRSIPLQRYGTAEEVARLTLFLASDAGAYCTGGVYLADGGMTAGRAVG